MIDPLPSLSKNLFSHFSVISDKHFQTIPNMCFLFVDKYLLHAVNNFPLCHVSPKMTDGTSELYQLADRATSLYIYIYIAVSAAERVCKCWERSFCEPVVTCRRMSLSPA
jgi:hypothetical protein